MKNAKFQSAAVQKCANLVDIEKCWKTHIFLQKSASIQPRTSPPKFQIGSCFKQKINLPVFSSNCYKIIWKFLKIHFLDKPSRPRAQTRWRERNTDAHGVSRSYFGVQFSVSASWPSNLSLFEWIPLRGCARNKKREDRDTFSTAWKFLQKTLTSGNHLGFSIITA